MEKPVIEIYADTTRRGFITAYPKGDPQATVAGDRLRPLSYDFALSLSEVAALVEREQPAYEVRALICVECGAGVWWGSGNYVNRIPVCDSVETNRECGRPYPYGTHICAGCERAHWAELAARGEACAEHERLLEAGACPDCALARAA